MLIAVAIWWLIVLVAKIPSYLLPAPDAIAARFIFLAKSAELTEHIRVTLSEIVIGFGLGGLIGVALGWLFVHVPRLGRLLSPLILLLQTAPKIAIAPLLLLWLGLDMGPKVTLIAIVTFFPVMAGAIAGFSSVEKSYHDLAQLLRLSRWQRFRRRAAILLAPDFRRVTHSVNAGGYGSRGRRVDRGDLWPWISLKPRTGERGRERCDCRYLDPLDHWLGLPRTHPPDRETCVALACESENPRG